MGDLRRAVLAMERGEQQLFQREKQLIIKLLNRQVGEIQSSLIDSTLSLNIDKLELLGEALLDFSSVSDLEQWLQHHE